VSWNCPKCDRAFDSYRGYSIHFFAKHDGHPLVIWHGEEEFKELCRKMSKPAIAERFGVSVPAAKEAVSSVNVDYDVSCPKCDAGFADYLSYANHSGGLHEGHPLVKLHGEKTLREMYSQMSENKLAEELGVSRHAVKDALRAAGIQRRGQSDAERLKNEQMSEEERMAQVEAAHKARRVERAEFRLSQRGYEYWRSHNGENEDTVKVHRLLMTLAVDDLDELDGKDVHHKNGVKWDNRLENLELMMPAEHRRHHAA